MDTKLLKPIKIVPKLNARGLLIKQAEIKVPMKKGFTLFGGLKTMTTPGRLICMSFKQLTLEVDLGNFYIISTDKGIYTTISPRFATEKKGGIVLFRLFINKKSKK